MLRIVNRNVLSIAFIQHLFRLRPVTLGQPSSQLSWFAGEEFHHSSPSHLLSCVISVYVKESSEHYETWWRIYTSAVSCVIKGSGNGVSPFRRQYWTLRDKIESDATVFCQGNVFENVVCRMWTISLRLRVFVLYQRPPAPPARHMVISLHI